MPQDNAASTGEKSEVIPQTQSASTAVTPETPTETTTASTSSLMDRLGVPAEVQQELKSREPQPEPESEVTAQAAEEPEAEAAETQETPASEEHSEEQHEAPKEWPESAKKRLAKERSKRGKAEEKAEQLAEEIEQLRAQLEATQPVTVAPTSDDLLADVTTEDQLEERKQIARMTRDFYRGKLSGFTVGEGTPQERFVPPEEVASILGRVEDVLNEHAPKKAAQLRERTEYDRIAKEKYPKLFDRTSEDYQRSRGILQRLPWLANDPAMHIFIGDYLRGAKARVEEENKAAASTSGDPAADKILKARAQTPPIAPNVPAAQRSNGNTPSRSKIDQAKNNLAQEPDNREALKAAIRAIRENAEQSTDARSLVSV